ncbi:MAG: aminopeptidase P family protein, partial [Nitrospinaceae bacterium]|nr:aminopeptidase P family protein [Nitrospinaceae bacterium]
GYFYHFHERFDAMGLGRYMALCGIPKGAPEHAFLIGERRGAGQFEDQNLWIPELIVAERLPAVAAEAAAKAIKTRGLENCTIAVEMDFLPASSMAALSMPLPGARFAEARGIMEELRAIKTPAELDIFRQITLDDAEIIGEVFTTSPPGSTTRELARAIEGGMTDRGIHFLWVFTCAGKDMLRAPSAKVWEPGEICHLDAGGAFEGYLTDVCRMGVRGQPSSLANELFQACLTTQNKVREEVRAKATCSDLYNSGIKHLADTGHGDYGEFIIHGVGLVSHELPRFREDGDSKLEEGMVVSIETDIRHSEVGYVKIEDTVAVTNEGCEGLGDLGRESWYIVD